MNVYKGVQSFQKSPVASGGLCTLAYFKIEDVLAWPAVNPSTGIITASIQMKPGKIIYICQAADKGRAYDEELKYDGAGPFVDMKVQGTLAGSNSANVLTLQAAQFHQWGIIVRERNGCYRLLGNKDSAPGWATNTPPATVKPIRKAQLTWSWSSSLPAPLYQAQTFQITIGGSTITAGTLRLLMRFKIGDSQSPMVAGATTLTDAQFAGKLMVIIDGLAIPNDDGTNAINWAGSIARRTQKTLAQSTLTFPGGVYPNEIIEIYEIS